MRDDPAVIALVTEAAAGNQGAWDEIVERYAPLVWSICVRHKLAREEIDDVGQTVWLLLVENIGRLREPAALPGWLATTTQRECLRVLRSSRRHDHAELPGEDQMPADPGAPVIEEQILAAERGAAIRAAFAELSRDCQDLLSMLVHDPPYSYAAISAALGVAVGSIGPMRARCLARLRRSRHIAAIVAETADGTANGQASSTAVGALAKEAGSTVVKGARGISSG
jgi:RNA polymerase sigma factor (sigma-70 family)